MFQIPAIPSWAGLHPFVVHFPLALLIIAPLFLFLGIVLPLSYRKPFLCGALILLAIGSGALFVAADTGEAASDEMERSAAIKIVFAEHQKLAATSQRVFPVLTGLLAALIFIPVLIRRPLGSNWLRAGVFVILLGTLAGGLVVLNAGHAGGRLVHELGVLANLK